MIYTFVIGIVLILIIEKKCFLSNNMKKICRKWEIPWQYGWEEKNMDGWLDIILDVIFLLCPLKNKIYISILVDKFNISKHVKFECGQTRKVPQYFTSYYSILCLFVLTASYQVTSIYTYSHLPSVGKGETELTCIHLNVI